MKPGDTCECEEGHEHITASSAAGQHGGADDRDVLAAKAALAEAEKSRNTVAIAAAKEAVKAAEAKAEKTSDGKAAGGESAAPAQAPPTLAAAAHNLGRPGPGEPSGFLVVPGRAERELELRRAGGAADPAEGLLQLFLVAVGVVREQVEHPRLDGRVRLHLRQLAPVQLGPEHGLDADAELLGRADLREAVAAAEAHAGG